MDIIGWISSDEPIGMLTHLDKSASPRKLRLFACACCRRYWLQMSNREAKLAILAGEQFADGHIDTNELQEAAEAVEPAIYEESFFHMPLFEAAAQSANEDIRSILPELLHSLERLAIREAVYGCIPGEDESIVTENAARVERLAQANLVREVFGNPFRVPSVDPVWIHGNDHCVHNLASVMYAEQRYDELPILADALEDAGCCEPELLAHLRLTQHPTHERLGQTPMHVRGCWALDLLRGVT